MTSVIIGCLMRKVKSIQRPGTEAASVCKMSTESMGSLDIVHGIGGKSGQSPWILWTKSREPTQTGQCPWTQWKVWTLFTYALDNVQADWTMSTESMGSLDIFHGQSPHFVVTELVKKNLSWSSLSSLEIYNHAFI